MKRNRSQTNVYTSDGSKFYHVCWDDKKCKMTHCDFAHSNQHPRSRVLSADRCPHRYYNVCNDPECTLNHYSPNYNKNPSSNYDFRDTRELQELRETVKRLREERKTARDELEVSLSIINDNTKHIRTLEASNKELVNTLLSVLKPK